MTEIVLTREAAKKMYSAVNSIVVAKACYRIVKDAIHPDIAILLLSPDGRISLPAKADRIARETTPLRGAPAGLLALVYSASYNGLIETLTATFEQHDISEKPATLLLKPAPFFWKRYKCRQFINDVLLKNLIKIRSNVALYHQAITAQRRNLEILQQQLDTAQRMMTGIGYEKLFDGVSLKQGTETVGPGGDIDTARYGQTLPLACLGLRGVSLFVRQLPPKTDTGSLQLLIKRAADGARLMEETVPVSNLVEGWNGFLLPGLGLLSIGDALLELEWHSADGLLLAMADAETSRFGDQDNRSLALRIKQGLLPPGALTSLDGQVPVPKTEQPLLQVQALKLPEPGEALQYYRGHVAHEKLSDQHKFALVTMNGASRDLQLHPMMEGLTAVIYKDAIAAGSVWAACDVATAHPAAPAFTYILAAIPSSMDADKPRLIDDIAAQVKKGVMAGSSGKTGAVWQSVTLSAQKRRLLELEIPADKNSSMDAVFAVLPAEGSISCGWCRWYGFYVTSKLNTPFVTGRLDTSIESSS
ncbi:DUF6212 domain-containing protein [Kordiimonas pumila]|uniref:DUF6212 domain-containing protein n=1 Tax=Kordiimonas pumila TaxID=2161677 RepID=A0ABV7D3V8_9PROT|nr:DUF6212 domain-containing protein [Kordiimonas pumila]